MDLLEIKNLSFTYPGQEEPALREISFSAAPGEFLVICGESGCGKTTLLKMIKPALSPRGRIEGEVCLRGTPVGELDERRQASEIGFVMQDPDAQIVTDKVWHELAFGLESLGYGTQVIRRRVDEMACFFGLEKLFRKETAVLSGGQKQLLNLASILVMSPELLLLDEPASQLDPIAAMDFMAALRKINRELGITILLTEHRLEEVFSMADRVLVMDKGRCVIDSAPREAGRIMRQTPGMRGQLLGLPSAVRIYGGLKAEDECPLTVREGRAFLTRHYEPEIPEQKGSGPNAAHASEKAEPFAELKNICFRYERRQEDILENVSLRLYPGEMVSVLGGNGAGKTTLLKVISAQERAYRGSVRIGGKKLSGYKGKELYRHNLALLPQNPRTVFLKNTVRQDYTEMCAVMGWRGTEADRRISRIAGLLELEQLMERHPYDLSGGEQQKAALGKILLLEPRLLLLDEPTKGIDAGARARLGTILKALKEQGTAILAVTHDVEFAAENSDRCAMLFDRGISSMDAPGEFFSGNQFYTTAANRMARHLFPGAVTFEEVIGACRRQEERRKV